MESSFDNIVDRRNTNCAKWDTMDVKYGGSDLIHLGVADMDFKTPDAITEGFRRCTEHGIYGYTDLSEDFYKGILRWFEEKNRVKLTKEEVVFCPRISISASLAVQIYTAPGEEVIIHTPSYDALYEGIIKNQRKALQSPLVKRGERFEIDFEHLESIVTENTRMYVLCSPFNPVCRVWMPEELEQIGAFCVKHNLILFVDEIHGDIVSKDTTFFSSLSLSEEVRERLVVASSLTKTFNIPGVIVSYLLIPNEALRCRMKEVIDRLGMHNPNIFAVAAVEEGLQHCDTWYEEMLAYVDENEKFTRQYFEEYFPEFHIYPREGTFLLWISYAKLGCTEEQLNDWFLHKAKVEVYMGSKFGEAGQGYFRMNIASPRAMLEEAYSRMSKVYAEVTGQ